MDKEFLFKPRLPEADVEIPGVGTVRVRGLSRVEVLSIQKLGRDGSNVGLIERHVVAMGMVDPALSVSDVERWQEASPGGEIDVVADRIRELSGIGEGAAKAQYKSV